jgi:hypothetical protein
VVGGHVVVGHSVEEGLQVVVGHSVVGHSVWNADANAVKEMATTRALTRRRLYIFVCV